MQRKQREWSKSPLAPGAYNLASSIPNAIGNASVFLHTCSRKISAILYDNRDIDTDRTCTAQHCLTAALRTPVKVALALTLRDARLLFAFWTAQRTGCHLRLYPIRGRSEGGRHYVH